MNTANIQLTQMDIIRQVLNISDMKVLSGIKAFLANSQDNNQEFVLTEDLQNDIEEARQEYKHGGTLHFNSAKEAQNWMDSL